MPWRALGGLLAALLVVGMVLGPREVTSASPPQAGPPAALLHELRLAAGDGVRVALHASTGYVRFLSFPSDRRLSPLPNVSAPPSSQAAALGFLSQYGALFGLAADDDVVVVSGREAVPGRTSVRLRQARRGVPVLAGEFVVQVDAGGRIVAAAGEASPPADAPLSVEPQIPASDALDRALNLVARHTGEPVDSLEGTPPELWLYDPRLLGLEAPPGARPVWRVDVAGGRGRPVRRLVLLDAALGAVALEIDRVTDALHRLVYDNANDPSLVLPGAGPVWREGDAPSGAGDADLVYRYMGDVHALFEGLGREGLLGAEDPLVATVGFCGARMPCPYPNAFWTGEQAAFGEGMVADDVVAHEFAHAVTDLDAGLFYYMQSGAISEGLSDAFGELVDLANGAGNDAPEVRWLIGEDLPDGPARDMADPPRFGHPDRMTSPLYRCGPDDRGGVHTNSGVLNRAVSLMVDGGTSGGVDVEGIGARKVARLLYVVQAGYLTSGSDYQDLRDALVQAAGDLVGVDGITPADAVNVRRASEAVEMYLQPDGCPAPEAPVCDAGEPSVLFSDDLERPAAGKWVAGAIGGPVRWYYPQNSHTISNFDATYATSGSFNLWGWNAPERTDTTIAMTGDVALPEGAYLRFHHAHSFEAWDADTYDGGVVEYSVDGGASWHDLGPLFDANGYNGGILAGNGNPLGGRDAFVGASHGYTSSRADLRPLAGRDARMRFRVGTDPVGSTYGWFVDDVAIYTCPSAVTAPPSGPSAATRLALPLVVR